jgi:hypothetical protein
MSVFFNSLCIVLCVDREGLRQADPHPRVLPTVYRLKRVKKILKSNKAL